MYYNLEYKFIFQLEEGFVGFERKELHLQKEKLPSGKRWSEKISTFLSFHHPMGGARWNYRSAGAKNVPSCSVVYLSAYSLGLIL